MMADCSNCRPVFKRSFSDVEGEIPYLCGFNLIVIMEQISKSFTECTAVFLERTFRLRKVMEQMSLEHWLSAADPLEISQTEEGAVRIFQELLQINVEAWNEQDLSLHFIGPMFGIAKFTELYRYNLFANAPIKAEIKSIKGESYLLYGKPDKMIASGYREPETPFFCFNEYKREAEPSGDPIGQLLSAMLVGQSLNPPTQPMYGCYVIGRDWYFVTLVGKQYCISQGFDATTDHVFQILRILKALKEIVRELTKDFEL